MGAGRAAAGVTSIAAACAALRAYTQGGISWRQDREGPQLLRPLYTGDIRAVRIWRSHLMLMRRNTSILVSLCLLLVQVQRAAAQPSASPMTADLAVFPRRAAHLLPVELAEFVADVVPTHGFDGLTWDYLLDGPIEWITDGLDYRAGRTSRGGLVRIRIQGKRATVLRERREEEAWAVDISTTGNPNRGPKAIALTVECFGAAFEGCIFSPSDALASPRTRHKLLCTGRPLSLDAEVYEINVSNKAPALLAYFSSGGSGGVFQRLEIHPVEDRQSLCSPQ